MKKTIITIALGILISQAVFIPVFLLVRTIIQDHKAIGEVVNFINQSIAEQQKQSGAQATAQPIEPLPVPNQVK